MTAHGKGEVIPGFTPSSPSWVIRRKETGEVICETFDWRKITALNTEKYEAIPIVEYLVSLNQKDQSP